MEIIAKTRLGCLIEATEKEVKEIINAVSGNMPEKLEIGQKIPAIDYASTITKLKFLKDSYQFKNLVERVASFSSEIDDIKRAVSEAGKIE